ncbi:MAG: rhodanese domain-containing protein, partial [Candidatus Magasanikbacteria bacterium CG_4_10_14_0_8_um_filter_42_12]
MYQTLLYYKIEHIKYPESEMKKHLEVCKALQLKGRILLSKDGINGNIGGTLESVCLYRAYMDAHNTFKHIDFKQHDSEIMPFPRLSIKVRDEIVTTEAREDIDWKNRGQYVGRDTFHEWLKAGEEMVIIDMRNDYEWAIGHFKNAVKPPVKYFREIKNTMEYYEQFKDKKIVMYCTGGIRCEPATALFVKYGFDKKNVYHLEGGIVKYAEKYGNEGFFEGKCFTFDDRIAIAINTTDTAV